MLLKFVAVFAHGIVLSHANDGRQRNVGQEWTKGAFFLAAAKILMEQVDDGCGDLAHMLQRDFIAFQGGVEHQALEPGVGFMSLDDGVRKLPDHGFIVVPVHSGGESGAPRGSIGRIEFPVDDGGIEVFFGLKVAEDDRFGYAGGGGDFARGGAVKAFAGKKIDSGLYEIFAACAGGEADRRCGTGHCSDCK